MMLLSWGEMISKCFNQHKVCDYVLMRRLHIVCTGIEELYQQEEYIKFTRC